ncbi:MAG: universal stress protein [Acidimicrobiales bacterium]
MADLPSAEATVFEQIVVGTDGSPTAARAVARAVELARAVDAVVHVVSACRSFEVRLGAAHQAGAGASVISRDVDADAALAAGRAAAATAGVAFQLHPREGEAVAAILSVAEEVGGDLIVVGSVGIERRLLGSVPRGVAQRAGCDVLIVHTRPSSPEVDR